MGKMIKGVYVQKKKSNCKKYKWFIPKALDGKLKREILF